MKKTLLVSVLFAASVSVAQAAGGVVGAGLVVGAGGAGFVNSAKGNAFSSAEGGSVAASQVNGIGVSAQTAKGTSGGTASVNAKLSPVSAAVGTDTTHYASSNATGMVLGNTSPNVGNVISNGSASFGQSEVGASGKANFKAGSFGGIIGIGGVAGIGAIGNIAPVGNPS